MPNKRSSAVMQQRKTKQHIDYYPTPPWATHSLMHFLTEWIGNLQYKSVWEPAAGGGHMVEVLAEYYKHVHATDLYDPADMGYPNFNFIGESFIGDRSYLRFDWVITNPPFVHAAKFVERAMWHSKEGVAMLCRIAFLEGVQRHAEIFCHNPPAWVLPFVRRVPMVEGRVDLDASSAVCYAWFVWHLKSVQNHGTRLKWLV